MGHLQRQLDSTVARCLTIPRPGSFMTGCTQPEEFGGTRDQFREGVAEHQSEWLYRPWPHIVERVNALDWKRVERDY